MDQLILYIFLFSVIVIVGQLFQKFTIPLSLVFVISGMLLSLVPFLPDIQLDPNLVLDIFLPLLIYQISAFSSWRDIKKQITTIASLSVGHVVFITLLVAVVIHALIPQMGWPLAFVLGAILSPPDDVAIVSICEKLHIPERIFIILEGEGMFNDAAALSLFRFALAAALTHQFSFIHAISSFFLIIIGEIVYGYILGQLIGRLRLKITNTTLHLVASILTPFLAYIPVVLLGGTGVLATAVVGFIIGNYYSVHFKPAFRLISLGLWPAFAFAIQSLIFLLVGLDLRSLYMRISSIPLASLALYVSVVIVVIFIGRFIWVYGWIILFSNPLLSRRQKEKRLSLRNAFFVAWAGIRGGISLAAALAMPVLYFQVEGVDLRDLLVFLVFCVIIFTLVIQGLSLPYIIKKLGFDTLGVSERYKEHLSELETRVKMIQAALKWLEKYKQKITGTDNKKLLTDVNFYMNEYKTLLKKYQARISDHEGGEDHNERSEIKESLFLLRQIIKVEKNELIHLWRDEQINLRTRNKLLMMLDHQLQQFAI